MIGIKVVQCRWFPPKPYYCITIFRWIIARKDYLAEAAGTDEWLININHEKIHMAQIADIVNNSNRGLTRGVIFYYTLYVTYFMKLWLFTNKSWGQAYSAIPFEREAYKFADDLTYLSKRTPFKWKEYK